MNILYQFVAEMLTFYVVIKVSKKKEAENAFKPLMMTRAYSAFYLKIGYCRAHSRILCLPTRLVISLLDDLAIFENKDFICFLNGRQAVSNDKA